MRRTALLLGPMCVAMLVVGWLIPQTAYSERPIAVLFGLWGFAYAFVGGLVAARKPENAVGWLMLAVGVLMSMGVLLGQYAGYVLLRNPSLPLGREAAWTTTWLYDPALCFIVMMLLLFPLGRAEGTVRTWTVRVCVAAGVLLTLSAALLPSTIDGFGDVTNPFALRSQAGLVETLLAGAGVVLAGTFVIALVSVVVRLRVSRGNERQQLKWIAYAMVLLVLAFSVNLVPIGLDDSWVGLVAVVVGLLAVPVSMAVAILRHQLYDIDLVINRTLVYGALTAVLVVTYLVLVLGLRVVLAPITGKSDLAVAASTLAVAALFRPLRARIQAVVDRRFYRQRYNAAHTLEDFSGRLRHEVDLDSLGTELRLVVHDTMQPAHVTLWLRSAP